MYYYHQITSRYPRVHGAPVHVGNPSEIGIADISRPDYGDAVTIKDNEICVFWVSVNDFLNLFIKNCTYFTLLLCVNA